ncbi:ANTAR domain-containing protein [Knoellia sp. CPCC 206450]|uniref:ANTAR domain-containing protein n=1 Tax=Knoellia tibetensis TaxID=3404798 RepID=UPI003B431C69
MGDDRAPVGSDLPGQLDKVRARMTQNRADIDRLLERADASDDRADRSEALSADDRSRLDDLDERAEVDRVLISELLAEGLLQHEHVQNLEVALQSSRTIGAAMGIIMANRRVDEAAAFAILRQASQDSNTKLRSVATDVVTTGDVSELPTR